MSAYLARSNSGTLKSSSGATDTLFQNERLDEEELSSVRFVQCTFANISFKSATLEKVAFSGCVFIGCYFRDSVIDRCTFSASRFISCEFINPDIRVSNFGFSRFSDCVIPFDALRTELPAEPNLRRDLTENLAVEAGRLGRGRDARRFRLASIAAHEEELAAGFRQATPYYKEHYSGTVAQLTAGLELLGSRISGLVWGHGERAWILLRTAIVLVPVTGVLLLMSGGSVTVSDGSASFGDCLTLSATALINNPSLSETGTSGWATALVGFQTLLGFVLLGLFVTATFRAVTRR